MFTSNDDFNVLNELFGLSDDLFQQDVQRFWVKT